MKLDTQRRLQAWGYFADHEDSTPGGDVTKATATMEQPSMYGWAKDESGVWKKHDHQVLTNWTLKDYQTCISWLEMNKALTLDPSERAWLPQTANAKAWLKNYKLYLEILKVRFCADEENLAKLVKETFDVVVERSIEEYYANEDMPCQLISGALNQTEQLLDAGTIDFAHQVLGQDLPLTVEETYRVLRSRLVESAPPAQKKAAQQLTDPMEICRLVCQKRMNMIQTVINETIAGMQKVTADVATDFRQGKVGF